MSHEIATTADGRNAIAYAGATPWHGLGQRLTPGAPLEEWEREAGLDWVARTSPVIYEREGLTLEGQPITEHRRSARHVVLYRGDTGDVLSVVSDKYKPVQPKQIIEFYRDLVAAHGFELETAGVLKDGKKVWALANTKQAFSLRDNDQQKGYLLLATSYDGSMATQARFTGVRVVCNNTIELATQQGKADVTVPHSTEFDATKVKLALSIGDAWEQYRQDAEKMSNRRMGHDETARFLLDVYLGLDTPEKIKAHAADPKNVGLVERFSKRLENALVNSPGAHMASARGLLWGVVQAVTHDVDFLYPSRSQGNRLDKAWFGTGAAIKQRAWAKAKELVA